MSNAFDLRFSRYSFWVLWLLYWLLMRAVWWFRLPLRIPPWHHSVLMVSLVVPWASSLPSSRFGSPKCCAMTALTWLDPCVHSRWWTSEDGFALLLEFVVNSRPHAPMRVALFWRGGPRPGKYVKFFLGFGPPDKRDQKATSKSRLEKTWTFMNNHSNTNVN